jgi:hypothetical protein
VKYLPRPDYKIRGTENNNILVPLIFSKKTDTCIEAEEANPEVTQALPVLTFPLGQLLTVRLEPGIPPVHNILHKGGQKT